MKTRDGRLLAISQVTGLIARRIVCHAQAGQAYEKGQRFGLIRFGSRTDVYLPATALVTVKPGDKTVGGSTIIARW
jgi:phosphatidylserine decarboxylase